MRLGASKRRRISLAAALGAALSVGACAVNEAALDDGGEPPPAVVAVSDGGGVEGSLPSGDAGGEGGDSASSAATIIDRVDPAKVIVDATHIYWLERGNFQTYEVKGEPKRSSFIKRRDKVSGKVDVLVADSKASLMGFTLDGSHVYFTTLVPTGGGLLQRAPKAGGTYEPLHRFEEKNLSAQAGMELLAVDGWVYFDVRVLPGKQGPEKLWRLAIPSDAGAPSTDGGLLPREAIGGTLTAPAAFAVRAGWVYRLGPDGTVARSLPDGGSQTPLGNAVESNSLALDDASAFWASNMFGAVVRARQVPSADAGSGDAGPPVDVVASDYSWRPSAVRVDATHVYWFDGAAIRKAPKAGGASTVVASAKSVEDLAVDESYVYCASVLEGAIRRFPK